VALDNEVSISFSEKKKDPVSLTFSPYKPIFQIYLPESSTSTYQCMASIRQCDAVNKEVDSLEREANITKQQSKRKQDGVLPLLDFPLEGEYV
jgi:hypothetical protein